MPLVPGTTLAGRWQIQELISRHTHLVFSAVDTKHPFNQRWVVAKTIYYPESTPTEKIVALRQAFSRQLNVLSLSHYLLPEPLDYVTADDEPVLIYSHSPGVSLSKYVSENGPLSPATALRLSHQIADFLHFLHEEGWLFLGINPNHFVWKEGSFRIVGFGNFLPLGRTSHFVSDITSFTIPQDEQIYFPAQLLSQETFGLGVEYYSLCLLYYFVLTGAPINKLLKSGSFPPERFDLLPLPQEVKDSFKNFLSSPDTPFDLKKSSDYCHILASLLPIQKAYDATLELRQKTAAIFADYRGLFLALRQQIDLPQQRKKVIFPFDLEGVAYPIFRQHPRLHKVALVFPGQSMRPEVIALNRDGWLILEAASTVSLATEIAKFLSQAHPQHIVLLTRSTPQSDLLDLLYSSDVGYSLILADQLKASPLAQQAANEDLLKRIGLLPRDYPEHKHLLWEFLIQTGDRDRVAKILHHLHSSSTGQSLVTRLARCPHDLYPFLVKTILSHPDPATTQDLLTFLLALGSNKFKLLLNQGDIVLRLSTSYGATRVAQLFSKYGLDALQLIDEYGAPANKALLLFGKDALKLLQTPQASKLLDLMKDEKLVGMAKKWHSTYGNLNILDILLKAPELFPLAYAFGPEAVRLFAQCGDVRVVKRAAYISNRTGLRLTEAAKLKSTVPHIRDDIFMAIVHKYSAHLKQGTTIDDRTHIINAIFKVYRDRKHEASLLQLLSKFGSAAAQVYLKYGSAIFPLIQRTTPEIIPLLCRFPNSYPVLEHYGISAYHFLHNFNGEAERLIERLIESSNLDALEPWLSPPLLDILREWYRDHSTLAPVYWAQRHPELKPILEKYGYLAALAFEAAKEPSSEPVFLLVQVCQESGADGLEEIARENGDVYMETEVIAENSYKIFGDNLSSKSSRYEIIATYFSARMKLKRSTLQPQDY